MKSVDTISRHAQANRVIARAMGYHDGPDDADTEQFMTDYQSWTGTTRDIFSRLFELV
jgi:hypothetical protein